MGAADILSLFGDFSPFPPSWFRLVRLVRLCRLLRLLRAQIFSDLLAMVQGILGGIVTLGWALCLMLLLIYFYALVMNVIAGIYSEKGVAEYFDDVPRSILTVFRCSFGDCSSRGGTPLFEHMYDTKEWLLLVVFCAFGFFFWVGLFNVVSAIFVESTMASASALAANKKIQRLNDYELWATNI